MLMMNESTDVEEGVNENLEENPEATNENPKENPKETNITPGSVIDKIIGMVYGHALGSAVGLRSEFKSKKSSVTDFPYDEPAKGFTANDWSADMDHLIIVMMHLIDHDIGFNHLDMAARLKDWVLHGFPELEDESGVGISPMLKSIINDANFLSDPYGVAKLMHQKSAGMINTNGALARTSILGAIPNGQMVASRVEELCMITHTEPQCVISCLIQALSLHYLIYYSPENEMHVDNSLMSALNIARDYMGHIFGGNEKDTKKDAEQNKFKNQDAILSNWVKLGYSGVLDDLKLDNMDKISYTYKSLGCSMFALQVIKVSLIHGRVPSFKKLITNIVAEGGDTDTNAAVAGAIMGAYLGYSHLPVDWIEALPHGAWLDSKILKFIDVIRENSNSRTNRAHESGHDQT